MPELPEVETIVRSLQKKVPDRTFIDSWTDFPKNIRLRSALVKTSAGEQSSFGKFQKEIKNKKILKIWRRGKNILFSLSGGKTLLIHQKMTGHLLFGKWKKQNGQWKSKIPGPLEKDPRNGFLHLILFLDNGSQLALSDMRKFAKIELWDNNELEAAKDFNALGPEPLGKGFTFKKFKDALCRKGGKIKRVLTDQTVIAGIGNIYSDEILWEAKIHPMRDVLKIKDKELKDIYNAIKKVLKKAIGLEGDSFRDYRLPDGKEGGYQRVQNVYAREGEFCKRQDKGIIQRIKLGGRSAHFCPICQTI